MYPKISIVTPSYNQGQFLEQAILSVLNQNYANLEYIIIDGGSTDNSIEIIKKYEGRLAYWISEPDNGQSDAINKGFKITTGEILAWLNSDDVYMPGALLTVRWYFLKHPRADVVYGNQLDIDQSGNVFRATRSLGFSKLGLLSRAGSIPQPAAFFRKHVLEKVGYLDTELQYCMDYDFFLRIAFNKCKIVHVPKALAKFRYHSTSKTFVGKTETGEHEVTMRKIQQKYWIKNLGRANLPLLRLAWWYYQMKRRLLNLDQYIRYSGYYRKRLLSYFFGDTTVHKF